MTAQREREILIKVTIEYLKTTGKNPHVSYETKATYIVDSLLPKLLLETQIEIKEIVMAK